MASQTDTCATSLDLVIRDSLQSKTGRITATRSLTASLVSTRTSLVIRKRDAPTVCPLTQSDMRCHLR